MLRGENKATGNNKAGFVAIVGGRWQMGISTDDSMKTYVMQFKCDMFLQFALVSAGQICLKQFALKVRSHVVPLHVIVAPLTSITSRPSIVSLSTTLPRLLPTMASSMPCYSLE